MSLPAAPAGDFIVRSTAEQIPWKDYMTKAIIRSVEGVMSVLAEKDILDLSVPERIQLAQDIWDSVAQAPESLTLDEEEKAEIQWRLEAYHQDPNAGSPWSVVRDRIRNRT